MAKSYFQRISCIRADFLASAEVCRQCISMFSSNVPPLKNIKTSGFSIFEHNYRDLGFRYNEQWQLLINLEYFHQHHYLP